MNKISKSNIFKGLGGLALAGVFAVLVTGCGDSEPPKLSDEEKKAIDEQIAPVGKMRTKTDSADTPAPK
nr:MAG: hypothetical protein BECKLFY1418B_GA0070995_103518 [Candidatus Kentron sp. LFY]VFK00715.1 MAG: hypothetical protein BECKLFY1418A_GA0070994_11235 [Candidatus Kentron sp. LFY]